MGHCTQARDSNEDLWVECSAMGHGDILHLPRPSWEGSAASSFWRPAAVSEVGKFEAALASLGLLSDLGGAVREWMAQQATQAAEAQRRREAPAVSKRASMVTAKAVPKAGPGEFNCKECGASFGLLKTLKLHLRNHKREEAEAGMGVIPIWRAYRQAPSKIAETPGTATIGADWRRATAEHSAQLDAEDIIQTYVPEVDEVVPNFNDDELVEYKAPTREASLAGYVTAAKKRGGNSSQKKKETGKGSPCPICGEKFSSSAIQDHVNECIEINEALAAAGVNDPNHGPTFEEPEAASDEEWPAPPEELLATLLEMELSEGASARFWELYEKYVGDGAPVEQAFLGALEEVLDWDVGRASSSNATGGASSSSSAAPARAPGAAAASLSNGGIHACPNGAPVAVKAPPPWDPAPAPAQAVGRVQPKPPPPPPPDGWDWSGTPATYLCDAPPLPAHAANRSKPKPAPPLPPEGEGATHRRDAPPPPPPPANAASGLEPPPGSGASQGTIPVVRRWGSRRGTPGPA